VFFSSLLSAFCNWPFSDLQYFPAKDTLHQSEGTGAGMLDDITVRIVGICPPQEEREMGLALNVVGKRLATLERRTAGRLMARAAWYKRCGEYRVRRKQKGYEKSRRGKLVAGSWHRQHRALPNSSIHNPSRLVRRRHLGRCGSDAHAT
jgi:hypothetical protein